MKDAIDAAIEAAETDWRNNVGEHDRAKDSRLAQMFRVSGFSPYGVPGKPDDKVPEWCGMAVVTWLIDGGLNPRFNTSFLHTFNVEAFFTYGKQKNVNPRRLDTEVVLEHVNQVKPIRVWHADWQALRRWTGRTLIRDAMMPGKGPATDLFARGDVLLIDWAGANDADHIALITGWDAESKILRTIEGNRTGMGADGKRKRESVVVCLYDLKDPKVLRTMYGAGRLSVKDFGDEEVR
jgi:hypothetical protein